MLEHVCCVAGAVAAHLAHCLSQFTAAECFCRQLAVGNLVQSIRRPVAKPVHGGAVDKAREHATALTQCVADRAEAEHDPQVRPATHGPDNDNAAAT